MPTPYSSYCRRHCRHRCDGCGIQHHGRAIRIHGRRGFRHGRRGIHCGDRGDRRGGSRFFERPAVPQVEVRVSWRFWRRRRG
ncbi:Hypothetical protein NTJ_12606 [Nesidiocoris tenuis]|uniref:Uncharacterized protein n=1 Tax=Nesidiocoris tenuis TaxID=355587 RepID=A0ABN7B6A4_9HEMI|nr:Hypothetical protein NTJ_12606 [Nesidiocoris tenuis]